MEQAFSLNDVCGYHAHIYFSNEESKTYATWLRAEMAKRFLVDIGGWCERPIGPHPLPMYQVQFTVGQFETFVPWLMGQRGELDILIHMCSQYGDYFDHTQGAAWLGNSHTLKLHMFDNDPLSISSTKDFLIREKNDAIHLDDSTP